VATAISWPAGRGGNRYRVRDDGKRGNLLRSAIVTVKVIAPVTTLPSGFDAMAVMAAAPWLTAVTSRRLPLCRKSRTSCADSSHARVA